jgi:hypothetical protein
MKKSTKAILVLSAAVLLCIGPLVLDHKVYWAYQKYYVLDEIKKHKFPYATIIDSRVSISRGMTSDWCWVTAYVTFQTDSTFEEVNQWYELHPEGIVYAEGGNGLDLLEQSDNGTIKYGVRYQKWIGALLCPEDYSR